MKELYDLIERGEDIPEVWNNITGLSVYFCEIYLKNLRDIYFEKNNRNSDNLYYYTLFHRVVYKLEKGLILGEAKVDIIDFMDYIDDNMNLLDCLSILEHLDAEHEFISLLAVNYYCYLDKMSTSDKKKYIRNIKLGNIKREINGRD